MGLARVLDLVVGVCCCHPKSPCIPMVGIIVTGAATVASEYLPNARMADLVIGACGHLSVIVGGRPSVLIEGLPAASSGSPVAGCIIGVVAVSAATVY